MKRTSPLLTKEDYWAIWIGGFILLFGLASYFLMIPEDMAARHNTLNQTLQKESETAPFKTVAYQLAYDEQQDMKLSGQPFGKWLKKLTAKPNKWSANPLQGFFYPADRTATTSEQIEEQETAVEAALEQARSKELAARNANFENQTLNEEAAEAVAIWQDQLGRLDKAQSTAKGGAYSLFHNLLFAFFLMLLFGIGARYMGESLGQFAQGFAYVFLIALVAYFLSENASMKSIGFGYAAWAILIGLLISNTIGTPEWVKPALQTSFYIKTALVLLGAEILLNKILAIGLPGIFVAWVVTPVVLVSTYWFGQKILKIPSKTLNMTISADMSVCGVSAAVATAAACNAKKEELTLAIGLSMIFTSVMMIVLPLFINWMGMPEVLGGAWIGGTIDATGAVVAAGAFLGDTALNVAATIKMIQNILIGVIAFGVAVYFSTKVENSGAQKVGMSEIWKRFPKFILGFLGASVVFSLIYSSMGEDMAYSLIDYGVIGGFTKNVRGWLFCLAFVSIGLSTNFVALKSYFKGGKPLILYLCGQTLNLSLTLLMAYLMFYKLFPNITSTL